MLELLLEEVVELEYTYYLYRIMVENKPVGAITFRIASDEFLSLDGHIGYEIEEKHRGHHYAYQACLALKPIMKEYYDHVVITCDPDNIASKKTIEKLGAVYQTNRIIPRKLKDYYPGSLSKDVYQWNLL